MPSFLHKTLRRSSYLLNVLEGCWLPNIESTQFLFNYGTFLEIYKFIPPKLLELIFFQPLFDRVRFICSGQQTSEINVFYALRENDIIEYKYQESEGFFISTNRFNLPIELSNPVFAAFTQNYLIVTTTYGHLYSINTNDKHINSFKTTECVLQVFPFSLKQFLLRIESGPKIAIYSIPELETIKTDAKISRVKYSFPYRDGSYVLFQDAEPNFTVFLADGEKICLNFPSNLANETVIDHLVISSSSTLILTGNGHLLLLSSDSFEYITHVPHSYRIFSLNATEVLIARHGFDHLIFDLLYKKIACQLSSHSGILNFSLISNSKRKLNFCHDVKIDNKIELDKTLITLGSASFTTSNFGVETERLSSFCVEDNQVTGLLEFQHMIREARMFAISYLAGFTQVLELDEVNNLIVVSSEPIIRTDVRTTGICTLDPYFLFQFYENGFSLYSKENSRDQELPDTSVVSYSSTKTEMISILSDHKGFFASSENSELKISKFFEIPFDATCCLLIEEGQMAIFGTKDMMLHSANMTHEINLIYFSNFSKLPSIPVSLLYTNKKKLLVGFEDGTVAAGSFDVNTTTLRDVVLISIGTLPVYFASDSYAISSKMYLISDENDMINMLPLNNKINPEFAVSIDLDKYLIASKNMIYAMEIKGKTSEMLNLRLNIPDRIFDCIPLSKDNYNCLSLIASDKAVSILNFETYSIQPLFEYGQSEKFVLMPPIDDNKNQVCIVTQSEQQSTIRMLNVPSIFDQEADDQQMSSLFDSIELKITGKISSVCGYKEGILIGVGNSILFYKKNRNDGCYRMLSKTSEIGTEIVSIITNNDFIFVGDRHLSVLILEYVESFQNFRVVGQETALRRVLTLDKYRSSVVGGDVDGNIFTFDELSPIFSDLSSSFSMFKGNRRLPLKMCFNVGEVVTKVASIYDEKVPQIFYSTVNGGFGAFLEKIKDSDFAHKMDFEGKFKTLLAFQAIIEEQLFEFAAIDHMAFRNRLFPSEVVLDLDLINMFFNFPENKKERVVIEVSSSLTTHKIETLINLMNQLFSSIC